MSKRIKLILLFFFFLLIFIIYFNHTIKKEVKINKTKELNTITNSSNIVFDVKYMSQDLKGNIYKVYAKKGEVEQENSNIIFLTEVKAIIELIDSDNIEIKSDFGKYNITNNDTIFSKNVFVNYLDNILTGDYLDFSISNNVMIISKNVIYKNLENILFADSLEMNLKTKDTKIYMFEKNKKVKIMSYN